MYIYIYSCCIWNETWTINTHTEDRLATTELWFLGRIENISWTQHVTNEEVLQRPGQHGQLLKTFQNKFVYNLPHPPTKKYRSKLCIYIYIYAHTHCQCNEWKDDNCKMLTRKNIYTFPIFLDDSSRPLTHPHLICL